MSRYLAMGDETLRPTAEFQQDERARPMFLFVALWLLVCLRVNRWCLPPDSGDSP